jgi:Flp pilus assembly protein TadG
MTTRNIQTRHAARRPARRRARGDDGAALVEFALVAVLLFTLLLGIISFGYLLSFRGSMQQSASEGARAAAAAPRALSAAPGGRDNSIVLSRANAARDAGLQGYGKTCTSAAVTCTTTIFDCSSTVFADTASLPDCITVKVVYDNAAKPYPVSVPLLSKLSPSTLTASSTEQLNDR